MVLGRPGGLGLSPALDRSDALHKQVARHIRNDIEAGVLRDGQALPSTRELAARWDVSVFTISEATTFTPAVAEAARRSGVRPAGGKICKVSLDDVRDLRAATGDDFQLYDGRCRHVADSVRAGATGVVAVPLCALSPDLPDRTDVDALQRTINRTQALIDSTSAGAARIATLTEALMPKLSA